MTIKQYGGVFGRNPTFNNVTIEGTLTFDGDIDINSDLTIEDNLYVLGSVGIGTTSPDYPLHVKGTTNILKLETSTDGRTQLGGYDSSGNTNFLVGSTDSTNVELWNYKNGYVRFATNSTERMQIDASGNVGIGTSSPVRVLDIATTTGGTIIHLTDDATGHAATDGVDLQQEGTLFQILNREAGDIRFGTNNIERLRIDASGNVGIGETSPSTYGKLVVTGSTPFAVLRSSDVTTAGFSMLVNSGSNGVGSIATDNGGHMTFDTGSTGASQAERMRIDASGNVGIGTNSPTLASGWGRVLHVQSASSGSMIRLADASSGTSGEVGFMAGQYGGSTYLINRDSGNMYFYTDGTERMQIDASGNLLVGTTVAGDQGVTIYGGGANGLYSKTTATSAYWITNDGLTSATGTLFAFYNNTTPTGSITITSTNVTNYNSVSDERLKENIADADDSGSKIDAIQVRKFDWKTGGEHQDYGFIAQELVGVAPDAVTTPEDPEEMMSVDPAKLVPMMLKEIQSLRARIAALES